MLLISAAATATDLQLSVLSAHNGYQIDASLVTSLSSCAAYQYLVDYDAATLLPGILTSTAVRLDNQHIRVRRQAVEQILFLELRIDSEMEFVERPPLGVEFWQVSGPSPAFKGRWQIVPSQSGSQLVFSGFWQPQAWIPKSIIEHFAQHQLNTHFAAMQKLAEQGRARWEARCTG